MTATPSKNRNGASDQELAFTIATRRIGEDEDGDAVITAIAEEIANANRDKSPKLTPAEKGVMRHFCELEDQGAVAEAGLREACVNGRNVSQSDQPDSRRRLLDIALKGLIGKNVLTYADGLYRRPGWKGEDFTDDMVAQDA